ncbi:MAG: right-handed parallel beta-helix repeat-containing protein, partial [Myxococcota bacterium]|nr:right-handed parallel beta-helix repeat-containing protein [Myxococcota bacterium]
QPGAKVILTETTIEATLAGATVGGGVGVFVTDETIDPGLSAPILYLSDSTVRDNGMGAVYIKGEGRYQLIGNDLAGGMISEKRVSDWDHGDAVFVTAGTGTPTVWDPDAELGLLLEDNSMSDSAGAGVFLDGASATLSGNVYEDNGVDLVWQGCESVDTPEGLDEEPVTSTELCPDYDYTTEDLSMSMYMVESEVEP